MKRAVIIFTLLFLTAGSSWADTIVLKSGENKKGNIIEEGSDKILFNSTTDGAVIEIPRSDITILDKDPSSGSIAKKGSVSFFTEAPKKAREKRTRQVLHVNGDSSVQAVEEEVVPDKKDLLADVASITSLEEYIDEWLKDHPEAKKIVDDFKKKFQANSDELDKAIVSAKQT